VDEEDGEKNEEREKPEDDEDSSAQGKGGAKNPAGGGRRRHTAFLWGFAAFAAVAGLAVVLYHQLVGRYYVSTNDAYVNGDLIRIQPQVTGTVTLINTEETQPVSQGQLLIELDRHDTEVALLQAKAGLAQSIRDVQQLFADEKRQQALVSAQRAQLLFAEGVLRRDSQLVGARGVSQEDFERTQQNARDARAGLRQALAALESDRAAIAGTQPQTHPRVLLAESTLRSAWLAWNRTRVLAPVSGYLVRRSVQLGQQVTPATEMAAMAPLDSLWIDANFKETQLRNIRIGQPVTVQADIYGSRLKYRGRVLGLTAGTGAALAVLPPENATGNWIKIVQRLPVRIGLDPRELLEHPLFLGLSTTVSVDIRDLRGSPLSRTPAWTTGLRTHVYAEQDAGVDAEIQRIVRENLLRNATFRAPQALR
jgi:membrane fusion protein (multidrug efflux system)